LGIDAFANADGLFAQPIVSCMARSKGSARSFNIEGHPCGTSPIVGKLLNAISRLDHQSSHADIGQALSITTAVRAAVSDSAAKPGVDFSLEFLDADVGSDDEVAICARQQRHAGRLTLT
jgi:hypothetical protein